MGRAVFSRGESIDEGVRNKNETKCTCYLEITELTKETGKWLEGFYLWEFRRGGRGGRHLLFFMTLDSTFWL